jgi:hypothetical protein
MTSRANKSIWSKVVVIAMLVASLIFALYLYPGPDSRTEAALALHENESATTASPTAEGVEAVQLHYRRSWLTNLMLLVSGSVGCLSWLRSRGSGVGAWIGLFLILGFLAVILGVVVPANSVSLSQWLSERAGSMKHLASIGAWSFVAAEFHRLLSFTLAVVTAAAMSLLLIQTLGRDDSA